MNLCRPRSSSWHESSRVARRAFTLIELLIVILIIAILSAPTTLIIYVLHTSKGGEIDTGLRSQLRLASSALIRDIKNARAVPEQIESFSSTPDTLILRQTRTTALSPEHIIYYRKDDKLYRRVVFSQESGRQANETVFADRLKNVSFSREGRLVSFTIEAGFTYDQRPYVYTVSSAAASQSESGE
jgi:prepilin-type N-terminal cleavage/methylation domain-containing protein